MAEVGLLGFPNAGKSTLLATVSAARPKVGDYPFTTLSPVLGVVEVDEQTFVAADIPGIIEGAHAGAGLGLQFLRHVERTRVLVHVVDASGLSGRDPVADLRAVREEVRRYEPALLERPQLVVASKRDAVAEDDPLPALRAEAAALGLPLVRHLRGDRRRRPRAEARDPGPGARDPRGRGRPGGARVKLGLMGGMFDPIHFGHLRAAENAREALGLDQVTFVPAAVPPHRAAPTASAIDRYAMVALATAGDPSLRALGRRDPARRAELHRRHRGGAAGREPGRRADPHRGRGQPRAAPAVEGAGAAPRALHGGGGGPARRAARAPPGLDPARVVHVEGSHLPIASSALRERVRAGRSVRYLVPDAVAGYIEKRGLYR